MKNSKTHNLKWPVVAVLAFALMGTLWMLSKRAKRASLAHLEESSLAIPNLDSKNTKNSESKESAALTDVILEIKPSKAAVAETKKLIQRYGEARPVTVNVPSIIAAVREQRPIEITLFNGEKARVKFANMTTDKSGTHLFEGFISSNADSTKRQPASLVVSGNYVEGSFPTKNAIYRIVPGPGQGYLVKMNTKLKKQR